MKKLMIAAAIVCAAAMSQAAQFTWSSGKIYMHQADTDLTGLVDGQTYTALTSGTKGYADKLNNATWTYLMTLSDGSSSVTLPEAGLTTWSSHKANVVLNNDIFSLPTDDSSKTYTWDIVITGNYTDKDGKQWILTSNTIHDSATYGKNSQPTLNTAAPTSWTATAVSVPEPTSAMLLLLGVAGMALRRRRA